MWASLGALSTSVNTAPSPAPAPSKSQQWGDQRGAERERKPCQELRVSDPPEPPQLSVQPLRLPPFRGGRLAPHELDPGHVPCTFSLAENLQSLSWGLCLISSRDPWGRLAAPEARRAPRGQMAESRPSGEAAWSVGGAATLCVPVRCSHVRVCVSERLTDPGSEMPSGVPVASPLSGAAKTAAPSSGPLLQLLRSASCSFSSEICF